MFRSRTARPPQRRRPLLVVVLSAALALCTLALCTLALCALCGPAGATAATPKLGCGLLKLGKCTPSSGNPASRVPGTPVAALTQVNQSSNGGTNPKVGSTPDTAKVGVPNPGVVPVVGKVSAVADDGAYVAYESRVDARTVDLMIWSPALGGAAPVRVLFPAGWSSSSTRTWPVLYLLHGGNDKTDYQSWTYDTHIVHYTANTPALIVMPSLGSDAFATNYWNYGLGGANQYDTFMSVELPQLLQRGYQASTRAAIAGVSSGGYSALALAALHPGEFSAAASYSGLPDTQVAVISQLIQFGPALELKSPLAMWGDALLQHSIWTARNPAAQVAKLRGVGVFVSSGNGSPGPLDAPGGSTDLLEQLTLTSTQSFVARAAAAGVPVTADLYGNGTHSWPYWDREYQRSWPILAAGLGISP